MTAPDGRNKHVDSCVYIWDYNLQASVYLAGKYHFLTLKPSDPICSTAKQIVDMLIEPIRSRPHTPAAPATESKFTCWRGDCKLHDDCIHSYGQEYPPCVDACAMQARKDEREQFAEQIRKKVKEINDSGTCPYGWEPEGRECNDDCTRCVVDAAIESLRGGATQQGGKR